MTTYLIFAVFCVTLVIGMPMGVAFLTIGLMPSLLLKRFPFDGEAIVRSMSGSLDSFLLLAIPLFMFSGVLMARGGISEKLFNIFAYFFGSTTGGYPFAVITTCLFYGAISGSGPATTAAVGSMTIPYMVKRGYDRVFAASTVAVAGGLGVIIPPSIPMIAYCTIAGTSVADMFIAGILPGFTIAGCLMLYAYWFCRRKGLDRDALMLHYHEIRSRGFIPLMKDGIWALMAPIIILGSIYSGIATPTEAASISVYYALFVSLFIYKTLKPGEIILVLRETVRTYAPILFVIASAMAFSRVVTVMQIARVVQEHVLSSVASGVVVLMLINVILLFAGMIMDCIPAMMIFIPIIMPLAKTFGIDPVHLGIIMVCNLAIGFVTPPLGANLFVTSNMTGLPILSIARQTAPYIVLFLIALALVTYVPAISLALVQ